MVQITAIIYGEAISVFVNLPDMRSGFTNNYKEIIKEAEKKKILYFPVTSSVIHCPRIVGNTDGVLLICVK